MVRVKGEGSEVGGQCQGVADKRRISKLYPYFPVILGVWISFVLVRVSHKQAPELCIDVSNTSTERHVSSDSRGKIRGDGL